jgi:internalin A
MAVLSDRKIVKRIQRLVPWNVQLMLEKKWSERCEYNAEGKLISLDLEGLDLVSLHPEIGQLTCLQKLRLGWDNLVHLGITGYSYTLLKSLPPEVGQLSNLRQLILWQTNLTKLPPEIGLLSNLQELVVDSDSSIILPPEIGQLSNLQRLEIRGPVMRLPPEIGQLSNLQKLTLFCPMTDFPSIILQLSGLKELDIWDGLYTSLPPEIGNLSTLQLLAIHNCNLTSLPPEIGLLSNLQDLALTQCHLLTSLPPEIGYLSNLQHLKLWRSRLTSLPPEIGLLSNLQTLDLQECQLTSLPPEIGHLSNLRVLDLYSSGPLTRLPLEIGQLPHLEDIRLNYSEDWKMPPPEIVNRGLSAIRDYLQALQKETIERYEGRLIIVGEARMGKSSLVQALQGKPFDPVQPLTHGIEVETITLAHPTLTDKQITLHVWDFGGQQIYHATHQFFLTHRSVYVLVWNAGVNEDAARLRFWLETITTLAPDARILLVATHHDQWHPALDIRNYQQDYLQIVAMYEVSNKDGTGLEQLKHALAWQRRRPNWFACPGPRPGLRWNSGSERSLTITSVLLPSSISVESMELMRRQRGKFRDPFSMI